MPIIPTETGVAWKDTTPDDLHAFREALDPSVSEVPMTEELAAKIDRALARVQGPSAPGMGVLVQGNRRWYGQLKRVLGHEPGAVDVIVPVHNAWHLTRKCLWAVRTRTNWPYRLIVVDDASDQCTAERMDEYFSIDVSPVIRNTKNRGFAASVNRGIRAGTGEYVCLLNSDVLVTENWLTKMVLALEADPRHAIVCPATNQTAVVDVHMSPGASYLDMNRVLESFAQRRYPEILPTGFCFMFRRSLLAEVGYFDEAFRDFGEETDWWWKVLSLRQGGDRYKAVMADDTYVFHERAGSYSALGAEKHMSFRKAASARFNQLHPEWVGWRDQYDVKAALGVLRQPVPPALLRSSSDRYRIAWLVTDARPCGAMRYIADIANELVERGVNAKVVVLKRTPEQPEEWLGELRCAPVYFASVQQLLEEFPQRVFPDGLLVAGTSELAPACQAIVEASGGKVRACLHAQSFEPVLASTDAERAHAQACCKLLPDVIASSQWVADEIAALGVKPFAVIHPGVDRTLFYPRARSAGDERPTVAIPMNPSVPWRGWDRGLELIAELEKQADARGIDLRILVYGVDRLPIQSRAICLGTLTQTRLAVLLGTEVDALVDPSHVHSYGMPCLEAAASRVFVFSWPNRGIEEYLDQIPAMLLAPEAATSRVATSVLDQLQGYRVDPFPSEAQIDAHDREKSVGQWIAAVESHFHLGRVSRRICMVVPHLRKWGGPTTMLAIANELAKLGHTVEVVSVYEDVSPSVAATTQLPIRTNPKSLPEADLYITNSDNPWVERVSEAPDKPVITNRDKPHISAGPAKRILLKLSHNPRFKAEEELGLRQKWDAVVCSTQWLVGACGEPLDGWNHPGVLAEKIGWWHYEHARFRCPPSERSYGDGSAERPFVIGTLIHGHQTKGTDEALLAMQSVASLAPAGMHLRFVGIGEVPPRALRLTADLQYIYEPTRDQMAQLMKGIDFWLSCSKSEGLGRLTLEAMSAGVAVTSRDTGSEHLKAALLFSEDAGAQIIRLIQEPELAAKLRAEGFETAERAADPNPCMEALQKVIDHVFE